MIESKSYLILFLKLRFKTTEGALFTVNSVNSNMLHNFNLWLKTSYFIFRDKRMFLRLTMPPILSTPILSAQTATPAPAAATTTTTAAAVHTNFISSHLSVETEPHLQQGSGERRGSYPSRLFGSSGSGGGKMEVGEFFCKKTCSTKKLVIGRIVKVVSLAAVVAYTTLY